MATEHTPISIPYSTIKRLQNHYNAYNQQISIPYSTIKSAAT